MSETRRKLRARAERRQYKDLPDEEIDETPAFSLDEKLKCPRFGEVNLIKEMKGEDLSFKYFQTNGFEIPILVREQKGLDMKVPNAKNFYVKDVERLVGSERLLDVMDVKTQKNLEMTLKEWCDYFLNPGKKELLNVISLEFSHTPLAPHVEPPYVIKQLDWVNTVWPQFLKSQQKESTNAIEEMKYPKVQKYCLMSVKGCYTDFHIDFGGTSVWYHILRGKKVFWLIPPTPLNMELYEQWVLSGKQSNLFFGDTVEHCSRITLYSGQTFFIPSGWIHAVFTPEDSLVFGGNFLFSCAMESQIKIYQLENLTKVPIKFRYPFFNELHWYVLSNYLECLTGRCYLTTSNDGTPLIDKASQDDKKEHFTQSKWNLKEKDVYLEQYELVGLKVLVKYLSKLPRSKQCVPSLITNAVALLNDAKQLTSNLKPFEKAERTNLSSSHPVLYWLCQINYESYNKASALKASSANEPASVQKPESSQQSSTLSSPLKSWGVGLQNTVNTKFIAYKNKLNSEADSDSKRQKTASASNQPAKLDKLPSEIPNSFEKLIAATDISNKKQTTAKISSSNPPMASNLIVSSAANPVNNVYLAHPNSTSAIKPLQPNVLTTPATSMNIFPGTNSNLIMNRPMFNAPIVTSGMHAGGLQPGGIICTNQGYLQPNLYAPLQSGPMPIRNDFSYPLLSNAPLLTPAGQPVLTSGDIQTVQMNNQLSAGGKLESQQQKNKFTTGSWMQPPTSIQQQQPQQQSKTSSSTAGSSSSNSNKPSKSSKQSNKQVAQQPSPYNPLPSSQASSINHSTIGSTIISQQAYNPNAPNIALTSTPQPHPFLSTFSPATAGNMKPGAVNSVFNLADPNRPSPMINFAGQPTTAGFIAPTLNTNLAHPLNQNFIIAPVGNNNLIGNNLIPNQIYPNFNMIPGNMIVNTGLNPGLMPVQQSTAQLTNVVQQQPTPVVIGKPTIKLQRINCRKCVPCNRNACGLCSPCKEYFAKFGQMPPANNLAFSGQTSSEICLAKKCLNPILPYAAVCCVCGKSGWHNLVINPSDQQQIMQLESKCNILECDTCNQIVHLDCVRAHLPPSQKSMEGRMNNHLSNSWTCPVCVPIKDKEASSKLDSALHKSRTISTAPRDNNVQNPGDAQSTNKSRNESMDKLKRPQGDLQTTNKHPNVGKDQSSKPSLFSKSSASASNNVKQPAKTYSTSDQSSKTAHQKEVYDFDDADDEIELQTKFSTKLKKPELPKNDHYKNVNKKKGASDYQSSSIKLPPKKMAKAKLDDQGERLSGSKFGGNYESEDKLLLLATTSCQKSPIEKSSPFKHLEQSKSNKYAAAAATAASLAGSGEKKRSLSISSEDKNSNLSKAAPAKLNTSVASSSGVNVQLNSNKSRNKQMQSVRGRLEQQLKVLKKKTDSKNFNMTAYRKFVTNQPVKANLGTKSATSTGNATAAQSNSSAKQDSSSATATDVVKETVVANCLKNDCILYPNSSKDKDNKDALLNKFKNLSSTSIDSSFAKEDSSDSILGKLEIDTNLESNEKKDKSPKTPTKQKAADTALNSPSNKNLYECDSNPAKLLPMSYSIEKLASSTSIINQPLEPVPPSVFGVFDGGLGSDPTKNQFVKKQIDLFPNLNRYSSSFSNWSNAFKANQEKQSSPSFNYTSTTSVFGAFSRSNPQTGTGNLLSSPTFGSLSSPFKESTFAQSEKDKKAAASKRDLDKDYFTSTDDEAERPKERSKKKKKGKQAAKQQKAAVITDEDTDVQTDIDDQLNEDVQRVIKQQLMSEDDDEVELPAPQVSAKKSTKKGKSAGKETTTIAKKGKKAEPKSKAVQPAKRVKNNKAGKSTKKSKAPEEEEDEDEQLTEEEDEEVDEPVKTKAKGKGKAAAAKGKQQKASPASSKNRTPLNASSSTTSSVSTAKKGKQVKKTSPASAIKSKQPKNSKAKSKSAASASSETKRERKSEVDRLLDQSSDSFNDFMFTEEVYETIADKVKRNLGRKSKQVAAAAVSAMSVPDRVQPPAKQPIDKEPTASTPVKTEKAKGSAKKSAAAKNQPKSKKQTPASNKKQQNTSKDDETDVETEDETINDDDSSFEEPVSNKKSTSRNSGASTAGKKRKAAETSSPATKRKPGRPKSSK